MDYSKETFPLNHFALYCKGWYQSVNKEEKMIDTISRVLTLDGYEFAKDVHTIMRVILSEIDRYNSWLIQNKKLDLKLYDLYMDAYKTMNWWHWCDTFEEAMIFRIVAFIQDKGKSEIVLERPIYSRSLRKKGLMFRQIYREHYHGMTYAEQNRMANKIFGNKSKK